LSALAAGQGRGKRDVENSGVLLDEIVGRLAPFALVSLGPGQP
jgi:hypothetical protein